MTRTLIIAALVCAGPLAVPAVAQGVFIDPPPTVVQPMPLTGKRAHVARELRHFGFGAVDMSRLSNRKVVLLDNAIHSNRSQGEKANRIASILRGGGLLQGIVDGFGRRN
ncbi:hypothetical protein MWU52_10025 [Jannaschia sp. S6380]|uniref:hypothetical protein n=1 Tax=Jannaschia sp. S6380 TaxID=2926408 RepID=UPI001FF16694|nr:hypothetical protein [Jannaschia sp. S6380]MCK0167885.1 hypothetical protein [Jannaschia sp. S6380]